MRALFRTWRVVAMTALLAFAGQCAVSETFAASTRAAPKEVASETSASAASRLGQIKRWGYQLRGISIPEIAASDYDLVVIDLFDRGRQFTAADIEKMRRRPDGKRRLLLAYLSIGEAERYRFYWKPEWYAAPPPWLGPENEEWRGNFPVRYWDPDWQKLVFGESSSYLDRVIDAGFDGAYLDRVDVFSYWEDTNTAASRQMVQFIGALAAHAKRRRPEFLVVPQNGEELLADQQYLHAIDGVAKEDLLYGLDHSRRPNAKSDVRESVSYLEKAKAAGKPVLAVEYLCEPGMIAAAEKRLRDEFSLVPYVGPRTLHWLGLGPEDLCRTGPDDDRRVALVLGMGDYRRVGKLSHPIEDAKAVAAVLRRLGFTEVRERLDVGLDGLHHELQRFAEVSAKAQWSVIYFAGLGLARQGRNYLLPVDAAVRSAADVEREGIVIERLVEAVRPAAHVRLLLLEACRPNAIADALQAAGAREPVGHGIEAQEPGDRVLALYAARCAQPLSVPETSLDRFTRALLRSLEGADGSLVDLIGAVQRDVVRETGGHQQPVARGEFPKAPAMLRGPRTANPEGMARR